MDINPLEFIGEEEPWTEVKAKKKGGPKSPLSHLLLDSQNE